MEQSRVDLTMEAFVSLGRVFFQDAGYHPIDAARSVLDAAKWELRTGWCGERAYPILNHLDRESQSDPDRSLAAEMTAEDLHDARCLWGEAGRQVDDMTAESFYAVAVEAAQKIIRTIPWPSTFIVAGEDFLIDELRQMAEVNRRCFPDQPSLQLACDFAETAIDLVWDSIDKPFGRKLPYPTPEAMEESWGPDWSEVADSVGAPRDLFRECLIAATRVGVAINNVSGGNAPDPIDCAVIEFAIDLIADEVFGTMPQS